MGRASSVKQGDVASKRVRPTQAAKEAAKAASKSARADAQAAAGGPAAASATTKPVAEASAAAAKTVPAVGIATVPSSPSSKSMLEDLYEYFTWQNLLSICIAFIGGAVAHNPKKAMLRLQRTWGNIDPLGAAPCSHRIPDFLVALFFCGECAGSHFELPTELLLALHVSDLFVWRSATVGDVGCADGDRAGDQRTL